MRKLIKLKVIFLVFFVVFASQSIADNSILPKAKPKVDEETKIKTAKKKEIYPQKKPTTKKVVETVKKQKEEKKDLNVIYPQKKPITVKVEKKIEKINLKSEILSKRDFKIAKDAFDAIDKKKWKTALKISQKSRDKTLYNLINYLYLKKSSNGATFYDYLTFISNNSDYPRINRLRYLAEHKINLNSHSPKSIIKWFSNKEPLSDYGKIKLGEVYIIQGNVSEGTKLIKEGWIKAKLSKNDLRYLRKKYKKIITVQDNIKRADWHAWEGKHWDVQRMLRYLPKEETLLYRARQLLMSRSYGVDTAISKVPSKYKKDIGLQYDRLKWRRKRGRVDSSLEILLNIKNNKDYMVRPDKWWVERSIIARSLIYKKRYEQAYKITSKHGLLEGPELAEAEWMSGWIALSFLKDPILAKNHFTKFYNNVGYPISLSRGAYWLGKTNLALKNKQEADKWFKEGSKYLTTYYGQLSHMKVYPNKTFELTETTQVDKNYAESFYKKKLVAIVHLLDEVKKDKYTKHILRYLANDNVSAGSEILAAKLATDISRFDFAIQVSKIASYQKRFHNKYNYPVISTPNKVGSRKIPEQALILSIIRQESEFDISARSRVGAQGLMQLMPYTAKLVAKQAKLPYSKSRLTADPEYNINLGSHYIAGLILQYEGAYPFATAAYNAGPKRVKYWKKLNKDPQKKQIDYVDWIELIKFKETRNYVQRVLENYNVYRYILEKKPVEMKDFFKDQPLF